MINEPLIHDAAFAMSWQILEGFAVCLREEEQNEAFSEIYECIKAGIECFENQNNRMALRLDPGRN